MDKIRFIPVRGLEENILSMDYADGSVYFATDTKRIYLDANDKNKIPMGGAGNSSIYYGTREPLESDTEEGSQIIFKLGDDIEGVILPDKNDLILNAPNGSFYRVVEVINSTSVEAIKLTVSGGGGGESSSGIKKRTDVTIVNTAGTSSLINGQDAIAEIQVFSGIDVNDSLLDEKGQLTLTITLQAKDSSGIFTTYYTETIPDLDHEQIIQFNFGKRAKESATSKLIVIAEGVNGKTSNEKTMGQFTMGELTLSLSENFKNNIQFKANSVNIQCNAIGNMNRVLDFYFDNELIETKTLSIGDTGRNVVCEVHKYLDNISHGYHTVRIELHQLINGEPKIGVTPLQFEIAVDGNETEPIIWLGDYKSEYFNYDDIEIPYYVWVPFKSSYTVTLYKDNIFNNEHPFSDVSGAVSDSFEIVDADEGGIQNFYTITCDTASRDILFKLVEDPDRDMHLQEQLNLDLFFNARGRSNNESETNRKQWSYQNAAISNSKNYVGTFNDFNWYNNGWIKTEDGTALRISNGASFSIPIGPMTFSGNDRLSQSHTFEFQFKIRNVQSYSNLISNITRYKQDAAYYDAFYGYVTFKAEEVGAVYDAGVKYFYLENDEYKPAAITNAATYATVKTEKGQLYIGLTEGYKTSYTNYDAFLKWYSVNNGLDYDEITKDFDYVQKVFHLDALACGYYSGSAKQPIGFGLGPQDAFFSNGTNTVNASYVEDQMINLSIVYSHADKLMSIFVNGVLTGVIYSTVNGAFTINSDAITFNSTYCDIDLYKFRIYRTDLTINEVVTNYAVDLKDVIMYDQNTLVDASDKTLFDFNEMIEYNQKHPEDPIMPYIVFDTTNSNNGDRLSWSKKTKLKIGVEFVNTVLDRAFQSGELEELARADGVTAEEYYMHHCPSWKGDGISMAVQGTSSEFYPRRNYKLKCSGCMTANRGPYAENNKAMTWFYMDNYDVGTTKFTMKIDFMESSGSYNRGLANLVYNAYSHHPLYYYVQAGAIQKEATEYKEATNFVEGVTYYYYNHKGNIKPANGEEDNITPLTSKMFADGPVATYTELQAANGWDKLKVLTNSSDPHYNKWYTGDIKYENATTSADESLYASLRTNVQGFPVLAFHKKSDGSYTYIGRYNMLTDKGSDETYGFSAGGYYQKFLGTKPIDKIAECWEFENNSREFCSFRDPLKRKHLSFNTGRYLGWVDENGDKAGSKTSTAPTVVEDFEYRYHTKEDSIDIIVGADSTRMDSLTVDQINDIKADTGVEITSSEVGQDLVYDLYGNWEKAVQWVWSTCLDDAKHESEILALPEEERKAYLIEKYVKLDAGAAYDSSKKYFKYARHLYVPYTYNAETWATDIAAGLYVLDNPTVTYSGVDYIYDSYEYRYNKFRYELQDHFNLDYLATYFVVTECLELYDSRGKNCMMASWGPMKEGGDYIWFPIFYDMDTQLGINNTGIPSFEFSIDATEEGTFSTNDSILWNNFYLIFHGQMLQKYQQLRGATEGLGSFEALPYAPFASEERIEGWYESDPTVCGSIVMRGQRPLSAINLDEYYKYIAITNKSGGGYLGQTGNIVYDNNSTTEGTGAPKGSYFYALQGDRSLSRIQFLKNRFNYLDSWLGQGIYSKSGGAENAFWGRLTANNIIDETHLEDKTSDKWVETPDSPYFVLDEGGKETNIKTHEFDAEYWLTLTPSRKSYLKVIADDSEFSGKYIDTPVKIEVEKVKNAIRTSSNYSEQLIYIYGTEIMKDFGDLYKLYLTELHTVDSKNLTHLTIGWDGLDKDGNPWYNHGTNAYGLSSMPLLQEFNFSNIQYQNSNEAVLDLSASEKLQNFRATGSNLQQVKFAEGVSLNTLYLPNTITSLELTEARQLTKIITEYHTPVLDPTTNRLKADKGLYIEGLTDRLDSNEANTNIGTLSFLNAKNLGYDAYRLLNKFYLLKSIGNQDCKIAMTEVDWTPYELVDEGTKYNPAREYYLDNGSYQLERYNYNPEDDCDIDAYDNKTNQGREWLANIQNGVLYVKNDADMENATLIKNIKMLEMFANKNNFAGTTEGATVPNITGTIYIDNDEVLMTEAGIEVDEYYVRNTLQKQYPKLKFFFKTLNRNYTARFILLDDDNSRLYTTIGIQTIKSDWFVNPIEAYGDISEVKPNYDFYGWATDQAGENILANLDGSINNWSGTLGADNVYTFYAIFDIHKYTVNFISDGVIQHVEKVPYGTTLYEPLGYVASKKDTELDFNLTYQFMGWSLSDDGPVVNLANFKSIKDYNFYAKFKEVSVYENVLNDKYLVFEEVSFTHEETGERVNGYSIAQNKDYVLNGKITLPTMHNGLPVVEIAEYGFACSGQTPYSPANHNITHLFWDNPENQVYRINQYAFARGNMNDVPKLAYIELPNSIYIIGQAAFQSLSNLVLTTLPSVLITIKNDAFSGCQNLELTEIGGKIQEIGASAFSGVFGYKMKTINIGNSVEKIGNMAFNSYNGTGANAFDSIYIGSGIRSIGEKVFEPRNMTSRNTLREIHIDLTKAEAETRGVLANMYAGGYSNWYATNATIYWKGGETQ